MISFVPVVFVKFVHKIPILDGALAMVSYNAANLIVSWIDHCSGDKADEFSYCCVPMLHQVINNNEKEQFHWEIQSGNR